MYGINASGKHSTHRIAESNFASVPDSQLCLVFSITELCICLSVCCSFYCVLFTRVCALAMQLLSKIFLHI